MNKNKGFTLIELLVVIAIIGILSSVVLASLNSARESGEDARIKANLANARAQAELYYSSDGNGSYWIDSSNNVCSNSIDDFIDGNINDAGKCYSSPTTWAAKVELSDGEYFCVDGTGAATTILAISGAKIFSLSSADTCEEL